jgi:hypothetical protein
MVCHRVGAPLPRAHQGRQLGPHEWVQRMHAPCAMAPFYGWITWLGGNSAIGMQVRKRGEPSAARGAEAQRA